MSALEQELIDKIRKLDEIKQKQLLEFIQEIDEKQVSEPDWLEAIVNMEKQLTAKYGQDHFPSSADTLNEIREERLNDLMGGE